MTARLFSFIGGDSGCWRVTSMNAVVGDALPAVKKLDIVISAELRFETRAYWILNGMVSNERYVDRAEKTQIVEKLLDLGRPEATCGALIAIRKNAAWWALTQDERMHIFREQSHHTRIGLQTFPELARRLHHCRDLSEHEPFDFLTWFEYAPAQEATFNKLVAGLRAIPEWQYVEREVDIRLVRDASPSSSEAAVRSQID